MHPFAPLIGNELAAVEEMLHQTLTGSALEAQVNSLCLSMVDAGGKRIRPTVAVLSTLALPSWNAQEDWGNMLRIAAAIELLHTATLIHDDVIDNSSLRRGVRTINDTSGNHAAVLAGDYLFTRCFNLLRDVGSIEAMGAVSHTIATLVNGELMQLEKQSCLELSEEDYVYTIYAKTGALFELSACAPALVKKEDEVLIDALKAYGRALGSAFQIIDDNLDYEADSTELGKKTGIDLMDGRITLPVILALKMSSGSAREALQEAIGAGDFAAVKAAIEQSGALAEAAAQAAARAEEAKAALQPLPDSKYKEALKLLADLAIQRRH